MKNKIKIIISIILVIMFTLSIYATSEIEYKTEEEIAITFIDNSTLTEQQKQNITNHILGIDEPIYTPNNIICFLLGHNTTTEMISVTYHRVYSTQPKCVREYIDVTTCSRCDYLATDVINRAPIFCCD